MTVYYFGYNNPNTPIQMGLDIVIPIIDAREMPNQYRPGMLDDLIRARVQAHPLFEGLVLNTIRLHKLSDNVAVGCSFGKHRSRAVAEHAAYLLNIQAKPWTQFSRE